MRHYVVDNVKSVKMFFLSDDSTHAELIEMTREYYNMYMFAELVELTYS